MQDQQNDAYIAIARACLKAINQAADDGRDRAEQIQMVYQAIDDAFQAQLEPYQQQLRDYRNVIQRIASGNLNAQQMIELADAAVADSSERDQDDPLH
ncbi:hypothetical protein ACMDCT_01190 [Halomonadaceae bacterium KBTZ08]